MLFTWAECDLSFLNDRYIYKNILVVSLAFSQITTTKN